MYLYRQKVMFQHCDPAGIVFYPRYFEMLNAATETWFEERLGHSFATFMAEGAGIPTARIEAEFLAPSRLGEVLEIGLRLVRIGRSSAGLRFAAACGAEARLTAKSVLVHVGGGRPVPWPAGLRAALEVEVENGADE